MPKTRVAAFVDGFNLYHAIHDLQKPHLKWVNLWSLTGTFLDPTVHDLTAVFYFSAYATWIPAAYQRHQEYVAALGGVGVTTVMGHFKQKQRWCPICRQHSIAHEEKETDVNAAIWLLNEARKNTFDQAIIMSGDSDLAPAVRMLQSEFPRKTVKVIAMVGRRHSKELAQAATKLGKLQEIHLERSLLPGKVYDPTGRFVAQRPIEYAPPPRIRVP